MAEPSGGATFEVRPCPHCSTLIPPSAGTCRHCGRAVESAEEADAGPYASPYPAERQALPPGWTFDMRPCPHCGTMITQVARSCRKCGGTVAPAVVEDGDFGSSAVERLMIPVGRPGLAIAAGYLGLFSLLPLVGVVSIVVSILALRVLKRNPKLHGRGRAYFGLVMGVVMTLVYLTPLVLAIIGSLDAAQGHRPRF